MRLLIIRTWFILALLLAIQLNANEHVYVCAKKNVTKTKENGITYVKLIINDISKKAVFEPWYYLDVGKTANVLISDGFNPFGKMNGSYKITDTVLYFFGNAEEHLLPSDDTLPREIKDKKLNLVRKSFELNKIFRRYISHDNQDTLWVEEKSGDVFVKIK